MNFEQTISLIAISVSIVALGVSVYSALLNRPRLRVTTSAPMRIVGIGENSGPYVSLSVVNVGTQPTTILSTGMSLHKFPFFNNPKDEHFYLVGRGYSTQLPKLLGAGEEAKIFTNITEEMKQKFSSHHRVTVTVSHTWSARAKRIAVSNRTKKAVVDAEVGK